MAALWVANGGVFVDATLRGGGEFGEAWHLAGMREKKQNVFDDFLSAAQWLIQNHYTNPSQLAIMGGSNGGLLVGAALTQRPDPSRRCSAGIPFSICCATRNSWRRSIGFPNILDDIGETNLIVPQIAQPGKKPTPDLFTNSM